MIHFLNASGVQNYFWGNGVNNGVMYSNQTNYYVVSGFDQYGCNDLDSVLIPTNGLPNVTTVNDQDVCWGQLLRFWVQELLVMYGIMELLIMFLFRLTQQQLLQLLVQNLMDVMIHLK